MADQATEALAGLMETRKDESKQNSHVPAGLTYLGQFIDHDITFDPMSKSDPTDPHTLINFRTPRLDLDTRRYFDIGDREDLSYAEKLSAYRELADEYFEVDRYQDFVDSRLAHVDELVLEWIASSDFDRLLLETVRSTYPPHEHERFVGHLRGLSVRQKPLSTQERRTPLLCCVAKSGRRGDRSLLLQDGRAKGVLLREI